MGIEFDIDGEKLSVASGVLTLEGANRTTTLTALLASLAKKGYIHGLGLSWVNTTTIQIAPGVCSAAGNERYQMSLGSTQNVSSGSNGANGLDTGSVAANTTYHVFMIGDSSGVESDAGLLSLSETSPTLPSGYDLQRRIGTVRCRSGAAEFHSFHQSGSDSTRYMFFHSANEAGHFDTVVVSVGTATSFTAANMGTLVPATARAAYIGIHHINNNGSDARSQVRGIATGADSPYEFISTAGSGIAPVQHMWIPLENAGFDYRIKQNISPQVNIWLLGYIDDLDDV